MTSEQAVAVVIAIIGILGGGGGIVALLKVRPEAGQVSVSAAQGAVIVQTGVIENLQREMARLRGEVDEVRKENALLRAEAEAKDRRIDELEGMVEQLQRHDEQRGH